jgi:hypothetical protein
MLSLVFFPGEPSDRHASMPRLRIQLHRDLPQGRTGGGGQHSPCCLRPLPRDSLVDAGRVGTGRTETEPLPGLFALLSYFYFGGARLLLNASTMTFHFPSTFFRTFRNFPWSLMVWPLASTYDTE